MQSKTLTVWVALTILSWGLIATATGTSSQSDEEYTLPVIRTWDTPTLSVGVVPPGPYYDGIEGPYVHNPYLLGVVESVADEWEEVIRDHGSSELSDDVGFNVTLLPYDLVTEDELEAFDIIAASHGMAVPAPQGVAVNLDAGLCVMGTLPYERGSDSAYRVALHEFGHCLGLGHPHGFQPDEDVMAYGDGTCISNLNLDGLHESFAPAFDRSAASSVSVDAGDYQQFC